MQKSNAPFKFTVPFAMSGARNTVPTTPPASPSSPALAAYSTGFPAATMEPIASGGVPPFGQDFNGLHYDETNALLWKQAGFVYVFDSGFAANSNIGGYPAQSLLSRADGKGFWLSTADNNTSNPDATGAAGWLAIRGNAGISSIAMSAATVTPDASVLGVPVLNCTGALTANAALVLPLTAGASWLVQNSTTGSFSLSVQGATGASVQISQGSAAQVYTDGTNFYTTTANVSGLYLPINGNAVSASKLANARTIALGGVVTGSATFDGSANITITASTSTLAPLASPAFTGLATFASRPVFNGNTPWDTGNFNPNNYALVAGQVFTGNISAPMIGGGGQNPAFPLDVLTSGGTRLYFGTSGGGSSINFVNAGNSAFTAATFGASSVAFNTGPAVFNSTVQATEIGIGNAPSSPLDVLAASGGRVLLRNNGSNATLDFVNATNSAYAAGYMSASSFTFNVGAASFNGSIAATGNITGANLSGTNTGDQNLAPYALLAGAAFTGAVSVSGKISGSYSQVTSSTTPSVQGAWIMWNQSTGGGETDFINNQGGGSGGHNWYNTSGTGGTLTKTMSLSASGNLIATGTVRGGSDARIKANITPIRDALAKVRAYLIGVEYDRIDQPGIREAGFIGQGVAAGLPMLVGVQPLNGINDFHSVDYMHSTAYLAAAITELHDLFMERRA